MKILKDNSEILTYCTCKSGARTLGGCTHSCAILYYLTVDKIGERSNAAQKKVSVSGVIDIRQFKLQKKIMSSENQSQIEDLNNSMEQ